MKERVKVAFHICHQNHHYFIIQVYDELADLGFYVVSVYSKGSFLTFVSYVSIFNIFILLQIFIYG